MNESEPQNFNTTPSGSAPNRNPSNKKLFYIIGAVVVAIILIAMGIFVWLQFPPTIVDPPPPAGEQNIQQEQSTIDNEQLTTEGWQTYRNDEFGFAFEYPSFLAVQDRSAEQEKFSHLLIYFGANPTVSEVDFVVSIEKKTDNITLADLEDATTREVVFWPIVPSNEDLEDVVIGQNNYPAKRFQAELEYTFEQTGKVNFVEYIVEYQSGLLELHYDRKDPQISEDVFNQILSTFRFVEEETLRIDSSVVWAITPGIRGCQAEFECVSSVMRQNNASEQAIAFVRETDWFAVGFQDYGVVDLLELGTPWRANSNNDYMLVNEQSEYIIIEQEISGDVSGKIEDYHILSNAFPEYSIWGADNWFIEKQGQSFLFGFDVKDEVGCHACGSGYMAVIAFEFDSQGNYLGPRLLEVKERE